MRLNSDLPGESLDFLGKVRDKAGDMEKRLKDKDKHGILNGEVQT